jgi:transcriptional regulator with XRE-family HTH domain
MTLEAVGSYLQRLREEAKISRHALSKRVETSDSQIIRIEQEGLDTRVSLFFKIIHEVDANPDDVMELLLSPTSTVEDGRQMADLWITKRKQLSGEETSIHPDILDLVSQLTEYELGKWVMLGQRIIEDRSNLR